MNEEVKKNLEKQQYRIVGDHSTVKICGWTKKMIKNEGECYKYWFYGIRSNQCLQMSTNLSCANRCIFCWRDYKAPVQKEWEGPIDEPEFILNGSLEAQKKLLGGFWGNDNADKQMMKESDSVKHIAMSLTGEPICYPKINEFIDLCHSKRISTFLVTNAQYWKEIENLRPVTQLYLSLSATSKEQLKEIERPLLPEYWERMNKSLDILAKRKDRTCLRITAINGMNMKDEEGWAKLVEKGNPDFVEVKGYMFVGASRQRLDKSNMPYHEDVVEFSKKINEFLGDYEIAAEHIPSRVVLFAKKKYKKDGKWFTWIDFDKFFKLVEKDNVEIDSFLKETPMTGISGKGTRD
ncbi:MAG: 4-demethylwyosine synthase TYW1 [Nanoarchaeota archaeon]|nr:4-demethylwyosine synthase TYW1 [Nanoarchaeota archaeon]